LLLKLPYPENPLLNDRWSKITLAAFDGSAPIDANISLISLTQAELLAHFVPNFVAMATKVGKCKI